MISGILMSVATRIGSSGGRRSAWVIFSIPGGLVFWGIAFFFVGHILADLVWYSLIAAAVAGGRHFLTDASTAVSLPSARSCS